MLITEFVEVKWSRRNREWFEEKGYVFTDYSNRILVRTLDLTRGSHAEVTISCDYCHKELKLKVKDFFKQRSKTSFIEDVCNDCGHKKSRKNNKIKYGVENPMHLESAKHNLKNTMIERYGVKNPSYLSDVIEKRKATCLENFGAESIFKTDDFKEKQKQKNLELYGTEYYMSTTEFKEKSFKTLFEKGNTPSSSQQRHIHSLVGGVLNLPIKNSFLDVALENEKIYIEYDGGGHDLNVKLGRVSPEEFQKREQRRSFMLLDLGWREIRIICKSDILPKDQDIINFIEMSKKKICNKETRFIKWDVDNNIVTVSNKKRMSIDNFLCREVV